MRGLLDKLRRRVQGYPNVDRWVRQGLELGEGVYFAPGSMIDPSFVWLVSVGDDVTFGPSAYVLAHDASTKRHLGYTRLGRVHIGARVFVGAYSLILPGVTIGEDAIIGAGSVVHRDVPAGMMVAGNPAQPVGTTAEYMERHRRRLDDKPAFPREGFTVLDGDVSDENRRRMRAAVEDDVAYVR